MGTAGHGSLYNNHPVLGEMGTGEKVLFTSRMRHPLQEMLLAVQTWPYYFLAPIFPPTIADAI